MNASAIHNHFIEPAHRAVNTKRTTVTLSNPNGAVAAGGDSFNCDDILLGHGATYRLKDVIITSFDNKDSTFQPSNQFASKAIVHPQFQQEADDFMKLGDIRGELFHGNVAGDPLHTEEIISNHGNRTNWDVICDIGTSIKQSSVADALTNYRPYEMQAGMGISANARGKTTGTIAALQIDTGSGDEHIIQYVTGDGSDNLQLETGLGEAGVECKVPPSLLKPQEGLDSRLINHDDFLMVNNIGGTAGPGGTSYLTGYAEAVGLDSFTVDVVTCPPCGASLGGDFI